MLNHSLDAVVGLKLSVKTSNVTFFLFLSLSASAIWSMKQLQVRNSIETFCTTKLHVFMTQQSQLPQGFTVLETFAAGHHNCDPDLLNSYIYTFAQIPTPHL